MAGNRKRRLGLLGKIVYTLVLLAYGAAIAFVGYTWLGRVYDYADQYELSRPVKAVDAYLETLNRDHWNDGVARAVAAMPHEAQSDEEIKDFVQEKLSSGVTAVRRSGVSDDKTMSYSLRCDGREIGAMTIVEDEAYKGKVDLEQMPWTLVKRFLPGILEWGLKPWKVTEDSYDFTNLYNSVEITVPSSYSVYINGTLLDSSYIVKEGIHYDLYEKYYNDFPDLPTKVTYRYDKAIGKVETEIRDEEGKVFVPNDSYGDFQYLKPIDEGAMERLMALMEPFTEKYLVFRSGATDSVTALANLKNYIVPGSDIDRRAQSALDGLSWAHTSSIQITDYSFNGAMPLIPYVYVCDVTATTDTYTYGKGEVTDIINMTVMCCDYGDVALAYKVD